MPKVTEKYLDARRQQVLDAAFRCFAQNGFYETTMQDIACEAGVSYGVVYHYFRSKEDVIEASWQTSHQARVLRYQKAVEKATIPEVLAEFLDSSVSRLEQPQYQSEMRLRVQLFGEALLNHRIGEKLLGVWDDVLEMIEGIINRGQERGEINPDIDARDLARLYIAIHDGLVLQKTLDQEVEIWKLTDVFWALHRGEIWQSQRKEDDDHGNHKGKKIYPES